MPESVRKFYEEAAGVMARSPRAAAALLRLAVQVLCIELKKPGKDLNADIGALVKEGLPKTVQEALDVVRVTGNHAVHPGLIEFDNADVAGSLFRLINIIVQHCIEVPSEVQAIYQKLPKNSIEAIERRDKGTSA
jgi:hypothetical protein